MALQEGNWQMKNELTQIICEYENNVGLRITRLPCQCQVGRTYPDGGQLEDNSRFVAKHNIPNYNHMKQSIYYLGISLYMPESKQSRLARFFPLSLWHCDLFFQNKLL